MSKLLGIDYGLNNLGLAIGRGGFVEPLRIIQYKKAHKLESEAVIEITKLIVQEDISHIVIGIAHNFENSMSKDVLRFKSLLEEAARKAEYSVSVVLYDEYKSTDEAVKEMAKLGISQKRRVENHAFAAAKILIDYMRQFHL